MSAHRLWRKFWRIGLGTLMIVIGLALCVLPGPGIVTIVAGLAIMADEFPPARRLLNWLKDRFQPVRAALQQRRGGASSGKTSEESS